MHHPPAIAFLGTLGGGEMLAVFVVILLLFGPKRLPEIARLIGRVYARLQRAFQDFQDQIMGELEPGGPPPEEPPEPAEPTPEHDDDSPPADPPRAG